MQSRDLGTVQIQDPGPWSNPAPGSWINLCSVLYCSAAPLLWGTIHFQDQFSSPTLEQSRSSDETGAVAGGTPTGRSRGPPRGDGTVRRPRRRSARTQASPDQRVAGDDGDDRSDVGGQQQKYGVRVTVGRRWPALDAVGGVCRQLR